MEPRMSNWVLTKMRAAALSTVLVIGVTISGFALYAKLVMGEEASTLSMTEEIETNYFSDMLNILWQPGRLGYQHTWPAMKFGWKIILGTVVGFFGAAFGSVGGVGGGGIYVPMLVLIIGFDEKSSTAISKCMIMGAASSTVYYNLKQRHPTLDLPMIDYDLALLIQPMLVLGISIGVMFNVIFADWMVTVLLIILFLGTSTRALFKGIETWKKETMIKQAAKHQESTGTRGEEGEYRRLPGGPRNGAKRETAESNERRVSLSENIFWKQLGILVAVWVIILALEIGKNYTTTCSAAYWILNLLQIPVAVGVSSYQSINLYTGRRVIASMGEANTNWQVHRLVLYCFFGMLAGVVGGLLGLGGGFIMGPMFLELGVHPQVSSATATFAMAFSSSMSVVEYYLLKRFPVPYAVYLFAVAAVSSLVGQYVVNRIIIFLGRASIIIFILSFTIFVSAISLGGVGIYEMIYKIEHKEYMGFEDLCTNDS